VSRRIFAERDPIQDHTHKASVVMALNSSEQRVNTDASNVVGSTKDTGLIFFFLRMQKSKTARRVFKFLDDAPFQSVSMSLLLLTLFISASWILGNAPDSSNDALYGLLSVIFAFFIIEIAALSIVQRDYFLSFFFAMDLIGTASLILDIGWITNHLIGSGNGSVIRATRTVRIAARVGRLFRLLRLLRYLQRLPCLPKVPDGEDVTTQTASKVSNRLSSIITLRVAAMVLICVIVVPFLAYIPVDRSPNAWLKVIKNTASQQIMTNTTLHEITDAMREFYYSKDMSLLSVTVDLPGGVAPLTASFITRSVLRQENINTYSGSYRLKNAQLGDIHHKYGIQCQMDATYPNRMSALFGIILILLVLFVLFVFAASFNNILKNTLVDPLESLMWRLRHSATAMLKSMKAYKEDKEQELSNEGKGNGDDDDLDDLDDQLETDQLEGLVTKCKLFSGAFDLHD
jgi:hypothetical protein